MPHGPFYEPGIVIKIQRVAGLLDIAVPMEAPMKIPVEL